jgi:hypothetical protein
MHPSGCPSVQIIIIVAATLLLGLWQWLAVDLLELLFRALRAVLDRLLRRTQLNHDDEQLRVGRLVLERISERVRSG